MLQPKKIYFYIAKNFLTKFALVVISVSTIVFIINLLDVISRVKDSQISWSQIMMFSAMQIPGFLENISDFLIALSAIITLFTMSLGSEITIIRASGMSLWQILLPIILSTFLLGVFIVGVFNPISIIANKKFNAVERQFSVEDKETDSLAPKNGIWLRQQNMANTDEEIIIHAKNINRQNLNLKEVNVWFFDNGKKFYRRIDADSMQLSNDSWRLNNVVINDKDNINSHQKESTIATDLKAEFISKKILNNFEDAELFSIYDLPGLINDLKQSGFSPQKFIVYYHSLLSKPFLFVAMVLIATFFAINNIRNKNNILRFVAGVMVALVLHIGLIIVGAIGASGLIPEFLSTWISSLILLSLGILLIFAKETIV